MSTTTTEDLGDLRLSAHEAVQKAEQKRKEIAERRRNVEERQREMEQKARELRDEAAELEADARFEEAEAKLDESKRLADRANLLQAHREKTRSAEGSTESDQVLTEAHVEAAHEYGPELRRRLTAELEDLASTAEAFLDQYDRVKELRETLTANRRQVAGRDAEAVRALAPVLRGKMSLGDLTAGLEPGVQVSRAGVKQIRRNIDKYGASR